MQLIDRAITIGDLKKMPEKTFEGLVKEVVDIEQEIMVVDADLHADQELFLLENGSQQVNLWGINLYPERIDDNWIEFDSMINLRPSFGNKSRGVDSLEVQKKIRKIVDKLVTK